MTIIQILSLSFDALRERKVRSALTVLMVVVGSALMTALNGLGAGFGAFIDQQFSQLAPNILFVTSAQESNQGPLGGGPAPAPKITLNEAVVSRIRSLPFVDDVIQSYQGQITLQSRGKSVDTTVFSIDPQKLYILAPTLEFVEGSSIRQNDPSAILVSDRVANPPGDDTPFATVGQSLRVTYSFVDAGTGKQKEESRSFVVSGIMLPTGNPTIDKAVVFNRISGDSLLNKAGKYDALLVAAEDGAHVARCVRGRGDKKSLRERHRNHHAGGNSKNHSGVYVRLYFVYPEHCSCRPTGGRRRNHYYALHVGHGENKRDRHDEGDWGTERLYSVTVSRRGYDDRHLWRNSWHSTWHSRRVCACRRLCFPRPQLFRAHAGILANGSSVCVGAFGWTFHPRWELPCVEGIKAAANSRAPERIKNACHCLQSRLLSMQDWI